MIEALKELSGIYLAAPGGLLIAVLIVGVIYQSRELRNEREISRTLMFEIWSMKTQGATMTEKGQDTVTGLSKRLGKSPN